MRLVRDGRCASWCWIGHGGRDRLRGARRWSLCCSRLRARDPAVFALVALVLIGSALMAGIVPSRRAMRLIPRARCARSDEARTRIRSPCAAPSARRKYGTHAAAPPGPNQIRRRDEAAGNSSASTSRPRWPRFFSTLTAAATSLPVRKREHGSPASKHLATRRHHDRLTATRDREHGRPVSHGD